jgi:hypothetical protein
MRMSCLIVFYLELSIIDLNSLSNNNLLFNVVLAIKFFFNITLICQRFIKFRN